MHAFGTEFFSSHDEVDFSTFHDGEVDSAIFLQQRKQPPIATKALCIEGEKLYSKE